MMDFPARAWIKQPFRLLGIVVVVLALLFVGCQANSGESQAANATAAEHAETSQKDAPMAPSDPATPTLDPDIIAAHNRFGYLIFADLVREAMSEEGDNVVLSPISVALALALAENGASSETALAIAQAMQRGETGDAQQQAGDSPANDTLVDDLTQKLNEGNLALLRLLADAQATGDVRLKIGNALWHRLGLTLSQEYADTVQRYYGAQVSGLDFAAGESVEQINAWANEATEGLIPKIVDELPGDLAALIANAVYFQGDWQTPFDIGLTRKHPFRLPSGEQTEVDMMYRSGSIEYYEGSFQAVRLPYGETGRTAMYLFLPPGGESIAAFAGRFEEIAGEAFGNFRASEGEVWIPRLDVTFKATLNEPLRRLGMGVAFDPASADFSRMFAGARPGDFYIGDVLHQTVLKVDETGTEAAAVTSIEVRLTSVPVRRFSFKADRPFLLAIRDDETGAVLFVGAINDPR